METNIQVIGNETSVIYYNLNKQYSNVNKLIITKEIILNSFDNPKVKELIFALKQSKPENYRTILNGGIEDLNNVNILFEMQKNIQDSLGKLSNSYVDVKLKDYTFMNSVSNSKFNVTIRCENFSITNYYIEKGAILSNIKNLIKEYLNVEANKYRLSKIDNIQIEIYETEEIYKHVYLKKESDSLILASTFGFPKNSPINYSTGCEFYISKGNDFKFFKNKQISAIIREHTKLVEKEIQTKDKILTNEDLVLINEKTKNIDDVLIEGYITLKNQLRILNVSVIENSIGKYSENGFVINKSSNNFDRISILTLRDNVEEQSINPKYILIKNDADIKEFISSANIIENIDGLILTQNFYNPILDKIAMQNNLDVLYLDKQIQKSLDEKIDWDTLNFENLSKQSSSALNPFSGIITDNNNKGKDELLERLKNLDLNTQTRRIVQEESQEIQNLVNNIIGSDQSSFNKGNNNIKTGANNMYTGNNNSGKKKSAIGMLADSVMRDLSSNDNFRGGSGPKEQVGQPQMQQQQQYAQGQQSGYAQQQMPQQQYQQQQMPQQQQYQQQQMPQQQYQQHQMPQQQQMPQQHQMPQQQQVNQKTTLSPYNSKTQTSSAQIFNNNNQQMNPDRQYQPPVAQMPQQQYQQPPYQPPIVEQAMQMQPIEQYEEQIIQQPQKIQLDENIDISKYETILATEIITTPNLKSENYFVDMNTISQVEHGKIYYLTLNKDEMTNPNLNYILPIRLNSAEVKGCYLLINNLTDYFLIDEKQKGVQYFVNIYEVNESIKKKFLDEMISKVGIISIICSIKDLDLIADKIDKIDKIKVKNLEDNSELDLVKSKILSFEKRALLRKN